MSILDTIDPKSEKSGPNITVDPIWSISIPRTPRNFPWRCHIKKHVNAAGGGHMFRATVLVTAVA